ncbi:ferredoxin--NADP reductase [bacterium]|nr:ferredoxin--NADP reductase [bacterium]
MLTEKVIEINHYSDRLFSFKTTRDKTFRFKNGEFCMIGLDVQPKKIMRAYSIVSTNYDDHLEFLSIKVPDGPLTSKLQHLQVGDEVLINPKTTGSLVCDYLYPKDNLVMLATGTGIAPFISIASDPDTYDRFGYVYLFHTVRNINELTYIESLNTIEENMPFKYIPTVTREPYERPGRFWQYINDELSSGFDKERDGVMVCGSPEMNKECRAMFKELKWSEGNTGEMGDFMLERAFVD